MRDNAYGCGLAYTTKTRVRKLEELCFIGAPPCDKDVLRLMQAYPNAVREIAMCRKNSVKAVERATFVYQRMKKLIRG